MKDSNLLPVSSSDLDNKTINPEINNQMQKSNFEPLSNQGIASTKIMAEPSNLVEEEPSMGLPYETKGYSKPSTKKIEPIYVRLDKFKAGLESFEEIKNKVLEIEELLSTIRETKEREEAELEEWEREIQIIKPRIEAIDSSVFGKLD